MPNDSLRSALSLTQPPDLCMRIDVECEHGLHSVSSHGPITQPHLIRHTTANSLQPFRGSSPGLDFARFNRSMARKPFRIARQSKLESDTLIVEQHLYSENNRHERAFAFGFCIWLLHIFFRALIPVYCTEIPLCRLPLRTLQHST